MTRMRPLVVQADSWDSTRDDEQARALNWNTEDMKWFPNPCTIARGENALKDKNIAGGMGEIVWLGSLLMTMMQTSVLFVQNETRMEDLFLERQGNRTRRWMRGMEKRMARGWGLESDQVVRKHFSLDPGPGGMWTIGFP
eukprot:CAMPEP_0117604832 /NCGR_PEP_ID=MMETSP0784-20121206/78886_1 /TAXON_ID=39447 /ORGANISM="" /LENGTH=139 /DNA_ID=CAMNT_0005407867 /DNA_START=49 /DNA_END=466 /DNA_ORIENTATION=-